NTIDVDEEYDIRNDFTEIEYISSLSEDYWNIDDPIWSCRHCGAMMCMDNDRSSLRASIVSDIKEALDECNPYAKTYRMVREKLQEENVHHMKLRLISKRGR
ncbi:helicase-like protein, partial [Trifolium medium]|nr:helicase-like protein [Trifolium medium]